MNDHEAAEMIKAINRENAHDAEVAHEEADQVLVAVLKSLGYHKTIRAWKATPKEYA